MTKESSHLVNTQLELISRPKEPACNVASLPSDLKGTAPLQAFSFLLLELVRAFCASSLQ